MLRKKYRIFGTIAVIGIGVVAIRRVLSRIDPNFNGDMARIQNYL